VTEFKGGLVAVVTDIRLESRFGGVARWQLALDPTLFSLGSTGGVLIAISPSGAQLEVPVLGVVEEEGEVWLVVDKPLTEGTEVTVRLLPAKA